jgi:hypothetical protein
MQYLRARYYNPATGTFNRLDPFAGNMQDPQSLHKYLYVHGDPIQGVDPSGEMSLVTRIAIGGMVGIMLTMSVLNMTWEFGSMTYQCFVTGKGGYDATAELEALRVSVRNKWNGKTDEEKARIVDVLHSYPSGLAAWDIAEFTFENKQRWIAGGGGTIENTLTFREQVYPVPEVNYVLWGLVNRLAYEDGICTDDTSRGNVSAKVMEYRAVAGGLSTTIEFFHGRSAWGETIHGKMQWAEFGWDWAVDPNATAPLGLPHADPNLTPWPGSLHYGVGKKGRSGFVPPKISGVVDP